MNSFLKHKARKYVSFVGLRVPMAVIKAVLGAFVKRRKAIVIFIMSLCPPAGMEQLRSHWMDFHEILVLFENLPRRFKFH